MPAQVDTTHTLIPKTLIVYSRERTDVWQCRYKIANTWVRCSTGKTDLEEAKEAARELLYEAKAREKSGVPVVTRKFKHVAQLAINRLENEATNDRGLRRYRDYVIVLNRYLIPFFGKHLITNIDYAMLDEFDQWRIDKMKKVPSKSTIQTHNAAMNRVFDEAVAHKFLTDSTRLTLAKVSQRGKADTRRPAFDEEDLATLLGGFEEWAEKKKHKKSRELGLLLKDYVCVLLETGARPGKELMDLKWSQIKYEREPPREEHVWVDEDGEDFIDEDGSRVMTAIIDQDLWLKVTGKTGTREVLGTVMTRMAFHRIAKRNYELTEYQKLSPFWIEDFLESQKRKKNNYVFRLKDGSKPTSFEPLFDNYLESIDLAEEISSGKKYTFYSLRHTYATLKLQYEGLSIDKLAQHMGTSVQMIEKHYSHLNVKKVKSELRGEVVGDVLAGYAK